jgi:CDP-diacylglycerol---serine O-phosphatidyltransferase
MHTQKKYFKVKRFFPNFITILAICLGFSSIKFALSEMWEYSISCILIAAFLDGMDGRVARFMNCATDFGGQLDSLADLLNFGASTGIISYLFSLNQINHIGWAASLLFVISMAMRLARFNATVKSYGPYLVGVPSPFGPVIALTPMVYSIAFDVTLSSYIHFSFLLLSSFLMVSTIPTLSLKKINIPKKFFFPVSVLIISIFCTLLYDRWLAIFIVSVFYIISIPFTYFFGKKYTKIAK